jgi:hypothetical protein
MHGSGIYTWHDGKRYEGSWCEGKRRGIGYFRWPDGEIYKGSWTDGKRNGIGFQWLPSGNLYQGNWKDDKNQGIHMIHIKASGDTIYREHLYDGVQGVQVQHDLDGLTWFTLSKS